MIEIENKSASVLSTKDISISTLNNFKPPTFKNDDLVLYYHPYNFSSQKVLLFLYEKCINFTPYAVDLSNGEQYSSWFLNLNAKGDVPVLQDGTMVIPDSKHIINYIDTKFSDNTTKLNSYTNIKTLKKNQKYDEILSALPVGALSLGSLIHDDLKLVPKPPFIGPIRKACLKNNEIVSKLLRNSMKDVNCNTVFLKRKLHLHELRKELVYSRKDYQQILDQVNSALRIIDNDMAVNNIHNKWLVSDEYTLVDINLGMLLHRLYQLGFENYYWTNGKMPYIENYFLRFKNRVAYQKLVPNSFEIIKDIWIKTPTNYKLGAGVGVLGMAVFAAFAHK